MGTSRVEVVAGGGEDLLEHARVEEEGGADVERKPSCSRVEVRPPTALRFSTMVTLTPERASSMAAASPPGPAPTMTAF